MFSNAIIVSVENISHDSELSRQRFAADRGLAPEASWADITAHDSELSRQRFAADRGLAPEASWADIAAHDSAQRHIGGTALQ